MRPIIVGMNNPRSLAPEHVLYPWPPGCAGHRLWQMFYDACGATMSQYRDAFERRNLMVGPWLAQVARVAASSMLPGLAGRDVVLLGEEVRRAFGVVPRLPWPRDLQSSWDWSPAPGEVEPTRFYVLPHPSGRNLLYNDPAVRREVGTVLAHLRALRASEGLAEAS